ncbi:MAG: DnaB-like helicase C-terminal domain-containing protein [Micropepsaceae bacterium]
MRAFDLPRPNDIDSEQQLLGCLLLFNEHAERLAGFLEGRHFAEPLHGRIYEAIVRAVCGGQPASPFTLKNEFEADAAMTALGGTRYLAELAATGSECADAMKWAAALHGLAFRRNLIAVAREIQDAAQTASIATDAQKIADLAERMMAEATMGSSSASSERFRAIGEVAGEVVRAVTGPRLAPGVMFGLAGLDELTGGVRAKELVIVGARPGMGKTAFAGHLALMAARQGHAVAFFSMEMSAPAATLRLLAASAFAQGRALPYEAARKGVLKADEELALFESEGLLRQLPLYVHEGRGLTPSGILLAAKRMQNKLRVTGAPLGLVIVDHIQKIRPERDMRGNKVAEMTEVSDALQTMAGTLEVPVVALSQLNRAVEGRPDRKPELSDLRESGSIEQDADLVLLLFREAYYVKKREPHPTAPEWSDWQAEWMRCRAALDIHVAKQRNGQEGHVRVRFDGPSSGLSD